MSDLDVLRELADQFRRPEFEALAAVARKRRRHLALAAAAGAAVVVLGVGLAGAALSGGQHAHPPAQDPTPTESPSKGAEWTPERTRAEGSPVGFLAPRSGPSPSGLDAQLYCIGQAIPTGSPCDRYHPYNPEEEDQHWALEVTQGGRSALFDVQGTPLAKDFDEDSILVQDGTDQAPRLRLLQADGTAVQLHVVSDLAPAIPGPDVMLISDLDVYRLGMVGPGPPREHLYLVDDRAGTLQLLDVPEEIYWWGPNFDEFLWGGDGCSVIWQRPDGSFDHHDTDCRDPEAADSLPWMWGDLDDWLAPGRMAVVEHNDDGVPLVVHASLDRGATWERIEVEDHGWDENTPLYVMAAALADVLRQLD